jgi:hypothetical protein
MPNLSPLLIPRRRRINCQIEQRDVVWQRVVQDGGDDVGRAVVRLTIRLTLLLSIPSRVAISFKDFADSSMASQRWPASASWSGVGATSHGLTGAASPFGKVTSCDRCGV